MSFVFLLPCTLLCNLVFVTDACIHCSSTTRVIWCKFSTSEFVEFTSFAFTVLTPNRHFLLRKHFFFKPISLIRVSTSFIHVALVFPFSFDVLLNYFLNWYYLIYIFYW